MKLTRIGTRVSCPPASCANFLPTTWLSFVHRQNTRLCYLIIFISSKCFRCNKLQYLTHANIFLTVGSSRKDSAYEVPSPSLVDQLSLSSTEDIPPPDYEVTPPLPQQVTFPLSRVVTHCLSSSQCTALVSRQCQAEESFFPWRER